MMLPNQYLQLLTTCYNKVECSGCPRLLREKRVLGDPPGASRGGSPTAADSEFLERKSTSKLYKP
ncbi:hypothetical protein E2R55_13240 [Vibrio vulnificus]|nr:hypothetical protein E2R55_13240 [Vibrio vulnificus]